MSGEPKTLTRFVVDSDVDVTTFLPNARRTGATYPPKPGVRCHCGDEWEHGRPCAHALKDGDEWEVDGTLTRSEYRKAAGGDFGMPRGFVPVVARDEATELRAGITRFIAAVDARDHFLEHEEELPADEWNAAFRRTGDEITDSVAALRRLAGGESEK